MTESTISISPKTSPYCSQIRSRVASPASLSPVHFYSSSATNRTADHKPVSKERIQLRKLNDQFLSYIERIRLFETYNNCLTIHCEHIKSAQERTKNKLDTLKQEFHEFQQERLNREKKDVDLENEHSDDIERQIEDYKKKKNFFQREHELYKQQIIDLQQQSIDIQAKTEKLRCEYESALDEKNHFRKQISYYQLLKSAILDEITRQRDTHQRIQLETDDLKVQKQLTIQAYEADAQAIEIQNDNILYDLTTSFRLDGNGKSILTQTLNEIREEYKTKDNEMREELHRKYLHEYNQHVKRQRDQNLLENNRENFERYHLTNELNSLHDQRLLLRQKLTLIQEHYKQVELNYQKEVKRQKDMNERYDREINKLNFSVQEYENLLNDSSLIHRTTIEDEVTKYQQLLEGSDKQVGLRHLVNMSNKIERFTPNNSPPASKQGSISISQPPVSRTRQNSTSETSYETAPVSTTTNQQYVTLDSVSQPLIYSDYDTDNDQSQTIQVVSGRSSRLISETDITLPNQESLLSIDMSKHDETVIEIPIDTLHTNETPIDQTLPFVPMNIAPEVEKEANETNISDVQQSPIISTLEKRTEVEETTIEPPIVTSSLETLIPITIDVDIKTNEELNEAKLISPSTSDVSMNEQEKPMVSPKPVSDQQQPEKESAAVEVPVTTVPIVNPLAKLISSMLPDAAPFVPSSNLANTQSVTPTPIPILSMNNDAPPFVPSQQQQQQHGTNQQYSNNSGAGHWNGNNMRGGGGGNRRGQNNTGGFHHGGGNQRSGGGGSWQQGGGGGHHKQRRGGK